MNDPQFRQQGFFRYQGSLTTPPCTEGIEFTVWNHPFAVTSSELIRFWSAMPRNARYTQPYFNRGKERKIRQKGEKNENPKSRNPAADPIRK